MSDDEKGYITLILTPDEKQTLLRGKEISGIKGNSDYIRFLLAKFVRDEGR